jgi:hypothetical protein
MGAALIPASRNTRNPLLRSLAAIAIAGAIVSSLPLMIASCASDPATTDSSCPNDLPTCANDAPSYKDDIAPIFERRCFECHADAGSAASAKNFSDYDHVFAQRSAILNNVYACKMPKKPAAPLAPEDRQKLLLWLKCNAPNN